MEIIIKRYEHWNRALNKYISSRAQYEQEMSKGGYVPFEKGEEFAEKRKKELHQDYKGLSKKAMEICCAAKDMADKKGNVGVRDRLVDGMKEVGIKFDVQWCPKHYQTEGGFDAT